MTNRENLVNLTKFVVFFKVEDDPELLEVIADAICKRIKYYTIDDLLTILANYNQTLSPQAVEVCRVINEEFCVRLTHEHDPQSIELILDHNVDLIKITKNMLQFGQMHETLKNGMIEYIE